jgi:hypothetical protein
MKILAYAHLFVKFDFYGGQKTEIGILNTQSSFSIVICIVIYKDLRTILVFLLLIIQTSATLLLRKPIVGKE